MKLKKYWIYLAIILFLIILSQNIGWTSRPTHFEGLDSNNIVSTSAFFDDNQTLYNSFTAYNSAYYNYVSCVEGTYNKKTAKFDSSYNNLNGTPTFNSEQCNKQANNLNNTYTILNSAISKVKSTASDIDISGNINIDNLKTNGNNNKILRSELDLKLQDLYSIQDSLSDMSQKNIDSTTFAFILWAVLASSMVLYIFTSSSSSSSSLP